MGARSLGARRSRRTRMFGLPRPRMPRMPNWRVLRRRLLAVAVLAVAIGCGYMLWLRDSSLVAVERVTVTGAEGEPAIEAALTEAADGMTTLHLDRGALEAAVADDPAVLSITTTTDFPHGLTIAVDSRQPVAYVPEGGAIVAADGVVLDVGAEQPDGLPLIDAGDVGGAEPGSRLEGEALALTRILGPAPEPLLPYIGTAGVDSEHGPVVEIGEGIELRFGDPSQAELKWSAAATVLADPDLDSAVYIDLSVPSRPVIG